MPLYSVPKPVLAGQVKLGESGCAVDQSDRDTFRRLLLARRAEIIAEAGRTKGGLSGERDEVMDEIDLGSVEAGRAPVLRIRERERNLLTKIDEALSRLESGMYGVCERCSGPIGIERLRARPVTTLCITCKAEQEEEERRRQSF